MQSQNGSAGRQTVEEFLAAAPDETSAVQRDISGLIHLASEALLTVDGGLVITACNRGAELIFGYPSEELLGQPIDLLIPERYRARHRAHVAAFVAGERLSLVMSERGAICALRKDGSEFPAEASIAKSDLGGDTGFAIVLRDITERQRVKADLERATSAAEQASLAKSLFLATMSHELRTPLNAVIGFASLIERQQFGDDPVRYSTYAADIRRSGEHLLSMINEILDLSRIEAGQGPLALELTQINPLIEESIVLVRERAFRARIGIAVEVQPDTPAVLIDRRRIKQLLINLLSNAVKFTPEGGRITITAAPAGEGLSLVVADTGVGIPPEHIQDLFEPFHQISEHRAQNPEGIGLGLPIVARICTQHGGRITVDSAVGAGTKVQVWLPKAGPRLPEALRLKESGL